MIVEILQENNKALDKEIKFLIDEVFKTNLPSVLFLYRDWLNLLLYKLKKEIGYNLMLISINEEAINEEVILRTNKITQQLRNLSDLYLAPILRYQERDLFYLKVINSLHQQHKQSADRPFALLDGNFAISPAIESPILYFVPASSLNSIIHIPLLFHEFGHYLYSYHSKEIEPLVIRLQEEIWKLMLTTSYFEDNKYTCTIAKRQKIIELWKEWIQELFCDVIGLQIGGVAYLKTFSHYLRMRGRDQFYLDSKNLSLSYHPTSWLRVRFLASRARTMGLEKEATLIMNEWDKIAETLNIEEEHHGYYHTSFLGIIVETLDAMFAQVKGLSSENDTGNNVIDLVNTAWKKYVTTIEEYGSWEEDSIALVLDNF